MRQSLYKYKIHVSETSSSEELLRIKTDINLTFHGHIISLCSKANKKLSAL